MRERYLIVNKKGYLEAVGPFIDCENAKENIEKTIEKMNREAGFEKYFLEVGTTGMDYYNDL
jgi:ribosome maturation factor RimP